MKSHHQLLIEQKVYRKRKRRQEWKRKENFQKNSKSKKERKPQSKNPYKRVNRVLPVPIIFCLTSNMEEVLKFAENCKKVGLSKKQIDHVHFDFSEVVEITQGAMALFLSIAQGFAIYKISVSCNLPRDTYAKFVFANCGIMEFVKTNIPFTKKIKNSILVRGLERIDQERTAPQVEKAMETVFGHNSRNQKLQGMIVEMMTNSVNHAFLANKRNTNWYLSIFHDEKNKRVKFCFIDNGQGIISTIHMRFFGYLGKVFNPSNVIKEAFDGKYGSRTKLTERGTGLLMIRDCFLGKIISNLKVITNNLFYDFESQNVKASI